MIVGEAVNHRKNNGRKAHGRRPGKYKFNQTDLRLTNHDDWRGHALTGKRAAIYNEKSPSESGRAPVTKVVQTLKRERKNEWVLHGATVDSYSRCSIRKVPKGRFEMRS
jgi:hypothetical protein